jgi:hypothetical protein
MWKKQDDAGSTPLEVGSTQTAREFPEALVEMVMGVRDNDREKLGSEPILQMEGAEVQKQPVSPPTMTTYTDALNKFIKNATEFIEQLPLLSEARDAYVQAMKASKELRQVLDSGDENLRTLMIRMEQMVNIHIVKSDVERKKPDVSKVEPIRATDQGTSELRKSV